jgi:hypothetical protein
MTKNIRFLDTDKWQGLYEDGKLVIECSNQDIGNSVMNILTERFCPQRTFKRLYMPGIKRCPEQWTDELEKKAK